MSYGPYRIQPEGRAIKVGEEGQFVSGECEESPSSTKGQSYRTQVYRCDGCGCAFKKSRPVGSIVRFCSKACRYGDGPKWLNCSKCHAIIGLGAKKSSFILKAVDDMSILDQWRKRGIRSQLPKEGSWRMWLSRKGVNYVSLEKKPWWNDDQTAALWMSEYKPKMLDWSYLWWKEVARIKSIAKYASLSDKEKREVNRSTMAKRCPDKQRDRLRKWKSNKRKLDPEWNVAQVMRSRLSSIMKSNGSSSRSVTQMERHIGCSLSYLRNYLESKFTKKMNWENYGTYWHVDHILPVSKFNHLDPKQVAQCWHFTNLAPLSATANVRKGAKILSPQMYLLL